MELKLVLENFSSRMGISHKYGQSMFKIFIHPSLKCWQPQGKYISLYLKAKTILKAFSRHLLPSLCGPNVNTDVFLRASSPSNCDGRVSARITASALLCVHCTAELCSAEQCELYSSVQNCAVQCRAEQCRTVQCRTMQCSAEQTSACQCVQ